MHSFYLLRRKTSMSAAPAVVTKLGTWLRESINRIKSLLPGAYKGTFGPEVQQALQKIEAELDSLETSL